MYAAGVSYTPARFCFLLAMWCARHHRPFAVVEDEELCKIFRMLYAKVDIPSRFTISRDIQLLHVDSRVRVIAFFKVCGSCGSSSWHVAFISNIL